MKLKKARCCSIETRDRKLLEKIIVYCNRIDDNLSRFHADYNTFVNDVLLQDACCMCVIQIGELVSELSDNAKSLNPSVPWRIIKDTRNFYVHAYGAIDLESVWETLINDIPVLRIACEVMLK